MMQSKYHRPDVDTFSSWACIACFFVGVSFDLASAFERRLVLVAVPFLVVSASLGAVASMRYLRWRSASAKLAAQIPEQGEIDLESGYATLTMRSGELLSIHIPDEVLREGPEATTVYIAEQLFRER